VKSRARNRLALWAYRSSDCVVCVSRTLSDEVAGFVLPKVIDIRTIYNPVDARAIQVLSEEPPEISLPGRFEDRIVAVGRLTSQKGFDVLLEALALIDSKNVRLLILGEGPERRALQELAEALGVADRVQFTGFVANVFAVMSRSAVFVLSSRYEGMPNALLEAIACGCKVVATDCPTGPSEILRLPEEGTLVPVDDPSALAIAVGNALDAKSALKTSVSLERFDPKKIVDQYYDALFSASLDIRHGTD
jgi:glycosyltransferase involved in cell wall biosynthesis